ncbi:MAG TPA: hypothetical protein ENJ95_13795 [Bacteroidetes bacterium]|nr:hypothetical protein [Bacteroidota bacterium]
MKKSILILSIFCLLFSANTMFSQSVENGKISFSAGLGLAPTFLADATSVNMPPVNFRATYQLRPNFGLSAYAAYSSSNATLPTNITDGQNSLVNNKQLLLGLRAEMRKELSKRFDFYGGGMLAFVRTDLQEFNPQTNQTIVRAQNAPTPFDPNAPKGKVIYAGFVGSAFHITRRVGLFAELGFGVSLLNAGITVQI